MLKENRIISRYKLWHKPPGLTLFSPLFSSLCPNKRGVGLPQWSVVKNLPAITENMGSIPGLKIPYNLGQLLSPHKATIETQIALNLQLHNKRNHSKENPEHGN